MTEPIDMVEFVDKLQARPKAKSCIVLTRDFFSQKDWTAKLAQKTGAEHIHLLDRFAEDESLCSQLGSFLVSKFFDFLPRQSNKAVLVVSGLEFLKATWSGNPNAMNEFKQRMMTWNKSPALVFVLQWDKSFVGWASRRFPQYTFVIDQKETLALL